MMPKSSSLVTAFGSKSRTSGRRRSIRFVLNRVFQTWKRTRTRTNQIAAFGEEEEEELERTNHEAALGEEELERTNEEAASNSY